MMMMKSESSSSSKITDIVRLQQILKKWKKLAINGRRSSSTEESTAAAKTGKFLKKTLSLSESAVPKGSVAVCVGEELRRFVIPMEYLGHHSFAHLLREAEEEFGFQQEGVLKFPCHISVFENTLKTITDVPDYCDYPPPPPDHHPGPPQMCR